MNNIKTIISIEGNIGVGKSSLLDMLKTQLNKIAEFITEPIDEWTQIIDENGQNLLDTFYKNKTRWSYTFQNIVYITRMNKLIDIIKNSKKKIIILDRSLEADLNTFAKMLYDDKFINKIEWNAYNKWNDFFNKQYGKLFIHKIIYLRCDPKIAYNRIILRNRSVEKDIPINYLEQLHNYHDKWLLELKNNILIVNANEDFVNDKQVFNKIYKKIMETLIL